MTDRQQTTYGKTDSLTLLHTCTYGTCFCLGWPLLSTSRSCFICQWGNTWKGGDADPVIASALLLNWLVWVNHQWARQLWSGVHGTGHACANSSDHLRTTFFHNSSWPTYHAVITLREAGSSYRFCPSVSLSSRKKWNCTTYTVQLLNPTITLQSKIKSVSVLHAVTDVDARRYEHVTEQVYARMHFSCWPY